MPSIAVTHPSECGTTKSTAGELSPKMPNFMKGSGYRSGGMDGHGSETDHFRFSQPEILLDPAMEKNAQFPSEVESCDSLERKTKIICTMGPKCWDKPMLTKLIEQGMNICRLNFSHGDHETHGATVQKVREAVSEYNAANPDKHPKHVAIMLDTKGPEIRTGMLVDGEAVCLEAGKEIILDGNSAENIYDTYKGSAERICVTYKDIAKGMKPGSKILAADGTINFEVIEIMSSKSTDGNSTNEWGVKCKISNSAKLGERKNMNLPGVKVDLPVLQDKDTNDLKKFGIPQGVDFIAASFVQCGADVQLIRDVLGQKGRMIKIISKIENEAGLKNFDEILATTDGIMVARGDLGMEIPPEKVFIAQKMMIAKCNLAGKHVITATQMMESCITNPRPTRAEASDVANAVLDGSDAVMLSGETANGSFPDGTVNTMRRICEEVEKIVDYGAMFSNLRLGTLACRGRMDLVEAVCSSAVKTALDLKSELILALTETGQTARLLAKYRPPQIIFAITASEVTARQLQVNRGVQVMLTNSFQGTESVIAKAIARGKELGLIRSGMDVVAVHGMKEECSGQTNLMKVVKVP